MKKIQMVDLQGQLEPIKSDVLNRFETILGQVLLVRIKIEPANGEFLSPHSFLSTCLSLL
ncbi:hypothetical protein OAX38_02290 [Flavobacteriaceae bacterium]|nr:hypothetical protein [Flavobacteriaceae bacterium]